MIEYLKPYDITQVTHGIIFQGCNARGVMGSGVAKAIRTKWPEVYEPYHAHCASADSRRELLGTVVWVDVTPDDTFGMLMIANGITQLDFGSDGKVYASTDAITQALETAAAYAILYNLPLYLPPVGCGLGGLSWDTDVKPIVDSLCDIDVDIFVCDI